jgi:hypothetical protein
MRANKVKKANNKDPKGIKDLPGKEKNQKKKPTKKVREKENNPVKRAKADRKAKGKKARMVTSPATSRVRAINRATTGAQVRVTANKPPPKEMTKNAVASKKAKARWEPKAAPRGIARKAIAQNPNLPVRRPPTANAIPRRDFPAMKPGLCCGHFLMKITSVR